MVALIIVLRGCKGDPQIKKLEEGVRLDRDTIQKMKVVDTALMGSVLRQTMEMERRRISDSLQDAEDERKTKEAKVIRKNREDDFQEVVKKSKKIEHEINTAPNNNVRRAIRDSALAEYQRQQASHNR